MKAVRLPPLRSPARSTRFYRLTTATTRTILRLCGGYCVQGLEHLPTEGPGLIAANHTSYLDPPAVASLIPRQAYFFAKRELFAVPVLAPLISRLNAFPVNREGLDREALRFAVEVLKAGHLLVVFPEGGRSPDGTLQPGRPGAAYLASQAGAPMIPCALHGADRILPPGSPLLHRGLLQISFGPPIPVPRKASRRELKGLTDQVMAEIARLRAEQEAFLASRRRSR